MLILAPEMEGNGILLTNPLAPSKNRTRRGKNGFFYVRPAKRSCGFISLECMISLTGHGSQKCLITV